MDLLSELAKRFEGQPINDLVLILENDEKKKIDLFQNDFLI